MRALFQPKSSTVEILLNPLALDATACRTWQEFLHAAARAVGRKLSLEIFSGPPADDRSTFAVISDSLALTRKLLFTVPRIYIQPKRAPQQVDPLFYWKMLGTSVGRQHRLEPRAPTVTLFSSIFDGDFFLPGFLQNCSALHGYEQYEHYLIRAASPGDEHKVLTEHVLLWPSAVYLNLAEDPGLYEVWNLGIGLAGGRYLSNANIDDRRAPEQVAELTNVLDSQPGVSVAAAGLRISTTPNLDWKDSADCTRMFGNVHSGIYAVDMLFQRSGQSLAARNLPHCMPVWRRSLHAHFGFFDEKRYGPSADWAYWLWCTSHGERFYFDQRPLGLYLRHEGSYWRRNDASDSYDRKIIAEYGSLATVGDSQPNNTAIANKTFSSRLEKVVALLHAGAGQEGIGLFLEALLSRPQAGKAEEALIEHIVAKYLGGGIWSEWVEPYAFAQQCNRDTLSGVFAALVAIFHGITPDNTGENLLRVRSILEFACFDLHGCRDDMCGLLLFAFWARCFGENELERAVLKHLHAQDVREFWSTVQAVYLFTRTLPDFVQLLSKGNVQTALPKTAAQGTRIVYFPQYTGNAYLNLLYEPFSAAGGHLEGTSDSKYFLSVAPIPGKINILHLHWIDPLLLPPQAEPTSSDAYEAAVLEALARQKARGFILYWTIHNYLGHECREPAKELVLRRSLYMLADQVFVHHPLAVSLLDWLPDRQKLSVCEHGPYNIPSVDPADRERIRRELGFAETDFVLTYIGRICDYKGLDMYLAALLETLEQVPHLKVVIAGSIHSQKVYNWLSDHTHPRLIVKNVRLADADLARQMQAADLGLLSYTAILTSGTLFHWLSCGRPVLGPSLGIIPAYLVNGWNGYMYRDAGHLKDILLCCSSLPKQGMERLGDNAARTARQLNWKMWQ